MINWAVDPAWESYTLKVHWSQRFNMSFGIVSEGDVDTDVSRLINLFCQLNLAHNFRGPVILFGLNSVDNVGAPIFNGSPRTPAIYHIPKHLYSVLDDIVSDTPFVMSLSAIEAILGMQSLKDSVFDKLAELQSKDGLVVVGWYTGIQV